MAAGSESRTIDPYVKDQILHYPTVELVRKLFPDAVFQGRSVLRNPLRDERHASLSCFRDRNGLERWKDHATGESGDNIDFYRRAFPELGYAEAVDRLSFLLLGRSAFVGPGARPAVSPVHPAPACAASARAERRPALSIVSDLPFGLDSGTPQTLVDYTRSRGISFEVAGRYFRYVRFCNRNRAGRSLVDPVSGLPLIGEDGSIARDDGMNDAVALPNLVGGYSLRVPPSDGGGGFKGTDRAFFSVVLADGSMPSCPVDVRQDGGSRVLGPSYDPVSQEVKAGPGLVFSGVAPWAAPFALAALRQWEGVGLSGRDVGCAAALLGILNGPVSPVAAVVEGMFDGASFIELERLTGHGSVPGVDLVVLNSLSNMRWAVPFLSMHGTVYSFLDNDMRSAAGEKAFVALRDSVAEFAGGLRVGCSVSSLSGSFYPCKDLNDYLKVVKNISPAPSARRAGDRSRGVKPSL